MASIRKPEEFGALTKVSGTSVSLAPSRVTISPFQYATGTLTLSTAVIGAGGVDAVVQPSKLYYVYLVISNSSPAVIASTSASLPSGFTKARLVGYFDTDLSSQVVVASNQMTGRVGDIKSAMCTEAEFQAANGPGWILGDARNIAGSAYAILRTVTTAPDLRGTVLRGKDNGRGVDTERPLGDYQTDAFQTHGHSATSTSTSTSTDAGHTHPSKSNNATQSGTDTGYTGASSNVFGTANSNTGFASISTSTTTTTTVSAPNSGTAASETRMKNVASNMFIKIN